MERLRKKSLLLLLVIVLLTNISGCSSKHSPLELDGGHDATEFKVYSYYGDNEYAKFAEEHEKEPWYDENAKNERTLYIGKDKVNLVYEYSTFNGFKAFDKYLWKENPCVKVYYFYRSESVASISTEEAISGAPMTFLPEYGDLLDKNTFTSYANSVFELFGYTLSDKEITYETKYRSSSGKAIVVEEFFVTGEEEILDYTTIRIRKSIPLFNIYTYCSMSITYDIDRDITNIELFLSPIPDDNTFNLSEEAIMKLILENSEQYKNGEQYKLELIDGKYIIQFESGYTRTLEKTKYSTLMNQTAIAVVIKDSSDGGASSCLTDLYILPADVTFP